VDSSLRAFPRHHDPLASTTSTPRSSPTPHLVLQNTPPAPRRAPRDFHRRRWLFTVEHLPPTFPDLNCLNSEHPLRALKLLDYFSAPPDHRSTPPAVLPRRQLHDLRRAIATACPDPIPATHRCARVHWCFPTPPPSPPVIAVAGARRSNPTTPVLNRQGSQVKRSKSPGGLFANYKTQRNSAAKDPCVNTLVILCDPCR
jgi:hypothetical protein